ncbi:hypothetical protein LP421_32785 (plasmid) [Rhizobium sp. RCAM05350]|uniref:plasmid mobilization protein n=1 Tax=Rhizobium sp. RCAM05350 TaxID=2895568 RepID=UPI0020767CA0|nr:hypothetical protein [Rhizobium sp. RCAM05350]URK89466.1 hypothetical protein LP421_32785 [Rhizobium sp. RCAM05350]
MNDFATDGGVLASPGERKDKVVHTRFGASEMAKIEGAAEKAGVTVSAFMRSLTLEGAGVRPFFTQDDRAVLGLLLSEISAVGVNLNQLHARQTGVKLAGRKRTNR